MCNTYWWINLLLHSNLCILPLLPGYPIGTACIISNRTTIGSEKTGQKKRRLPSLLLDAKSHCMRGKLHEVHQIKFEAHFWFSYFHKHFIIFESHQCLSSFCNDDITWLVTYQTNFSNTGSCATLLFQLNTYCTI